MTTRFFALLAVVFGCSEILISSISAATGGHGTSKPVIVVSPFKNNTGKEATGKVLQVAENYTEKRYAQESRHAHTEDYDRRKRTSAAGVKTADERITEYGSPWWCGPRSEDRHRRLRRTEVENKREHVHTHQESQDYNRERGYAQERHLSVIPSTSSSCRLPDVAADVATDAVREALINSGRVRVIGRGGHQSNGVDYIVAGSINTYNVKNDVSMVYGVRRWRNTVTVGLNMQLINASNQEIIAGKMMTETMTRSIPQGVILKDGLNDDWEELLRRAIGSAIPKFIDAVEIDSYSSTPSAVSTSSSAATTAAPTVSFEVKSVPMGAEVEYNHSFVGNTPCTVRAPAVPGILRITSVGYEPWEKRITPSADLRISPKLQKKQDR